MKDVFGTYHPIINFLFFCTVLLFSMFFMHPVFLGISLTASFSYYVYLAGKKALKFSLIFLLPMMILIGLINPLFNHRGVTIIGYVMDNPITRESILYGVATGLMFGSVILWFSCYNVIMTSDKFIYLFGRIIPALSLILSMVLRFAPRFMAQAKIISNAQKCIGRDFSDGNLREKVTHGVKILSIMTTWALENAIDTADSMNSRGYGLPGRTAFSNFRFDARDKAMNGILLMLFALIVAGTFIGENTVQYFPSVRFPEFSAVSLILYSAYFILCFTPLILNLKEHVRWRHLQSKI